MTADEQEAIFRRWFDQHRGLILKVVRGCAAPQDQDDLFQDVYLVLLVVPTAWGAYRLTQHTVRKALEPRRLELERLFASLNENPQ